MSKKDIKKKVLQYYVSQQDSYKKEKTLLSFLQLLIMNHTKKISFALLIVAFSIFSFSSPTDAAWKQRVKDITNKTVYIVKTILWDFTVQEQWGAYIAELKNGSWDVSMGIVTVWWSIWTWKDQSTWWIASFIDVIQSQAPMNKEILDYLRVHQNDKNQKKVEKWLSSIIQKYNKEEKWGRIVTGGFAKAVLWSSIINTWDILSWKINIITGATIQTIQWSAINVKDLRLIEIKK